MSREISEVPRGHEGMSKSTNCRVRVYRNLHTGTLSMQTKTEKGWRVTAHPHGVILDSCKFVVREGGRQRVLREKRKNVHAFIEGTLVRQVVAGEEAVERGGGGVLVGEEVHTGQRARYNPYKYSSWVGPSEEKVTGADRTVVTSDGGVTYSVKESESPGVMVA